MNISNDGLEWDSIDMGALRDFLATKSGKRLIPKLAESAPVLLGSGDTNAILIRNGELRGFSQCLREFLSMTVPPPVENAPDPGYPDLGDDSKWGDGQKTT